MSDTRNLFLKPSSGERIETTLVLPEPGSATLCVTVCRAGGEPVPGVLALLFSEEGGGPVDQAISDDAGRLCFGPMEPDRLYTLRVHERHRAVRVLEVAL